MALCSRGKSYPILPATSRPWIRSLWSSWRRPQPVGGNLYAFFVLHEHDRADEGPNRIVGHAKHTIDPFGEKCAGVGRKSPSVSAGGKDSTSGASMAQLVHGHTQV
jgi:hypothetical protein